MESFVDLPVEVHTQIRSYLCNPGDWVRYAMGSQRLWYTFGGDELIRHTAGIDRQLNAYVKATLGDDDEEYPVDRNLLPRPDSWAGQCISYCSLITRAIKHCWSLERCLRIIKVYQEQFPEGLREAQLGAMSTLPLHMAAVMGRIELIDALVDCGCPVEVITEALVGVSPVQRISRIRLPACILMNPLEAAVICGHEAAAIRVLERGAPIRRDTLSLAAIYRMPNLLAEVLKRLWTTTHNVQILLSNALLDSSSRTPRIDADDPDHLSPQGNDKNYAVIDLLLSYGAGCGLSNHLYWAARNRCPWNMVQMYHHFKFQSVDETNLNDGSLEDDWREASQALEEDEGGELQRAVAHYNLS